MTEGYRSGRPSKLTVPAEQLAYLATRMPATYAAVHAALSQTQSLEPRTLLDLGAGPGTATWAAASVFPSLESSHLVERNSAMAALGQRIGLPIPASWTIEDLSNGVKASADLVVLSYALGELSGQSLLAAAWKSANVAVALIEPGTPRGFALVRDARTWLITHGASIAAPCPHADACPMAKDDWCHFAARVERTSMHRRMKGGTMGWEDEKFSYVVAVKSSGKQAYSRIIRHPQHKPGYVQLELCTTEGLRRENVAKSVGALHRAARKADWGDPWPPQPAE